MLRGTPLFAAREVVEALPIKPGKVRREDYEYERKGTCCLLVAFEPLTGFRMVGVSRQRRGIDYTRFMEKLSAHYREAACIHLAQDNLNTHKAGSFCGSLPAPEAFVLAKRSLFHYTQKKASWLNMVEIEPSVRVRQCLGRHIEHMEELCEAIGPLYRYAMISSVSMLTNNLKRPIPTSWGGPFYCVAL